MPVSITNVAAGIKLQAIALNPLFFIDKWKAFRAFKKNLYHEVKHERRQGLHSWLPRNGSHHKTQRAVWVESIEGIACHEH
jgi:hypothetical protein